MFSKKKIITFSIILIVFIITTSAVVWSFAPKADLKPSEYGVGVSYETAMNDKKPFVALFYADWCTYCMGFMPKYKVLSEAYKDKYNFVMIDGDNSVNSKIVQEYAITGFPTLYIIDPTIDNRIFINQALLDNVRGIRIELDRYLRIRAMVKQ